jgi:hypothetical protein
LSVYFALVFTLGNAGVPYLVHTCLIVDETEVFLFGWENEESCFNLSAQSEQGTFFSKQSCCVIESGVLKSDVEVIITDFQDNPDLYFLPVLFEKFDFAFVNPQIQSAYFSNAPPLTSGQQIRILYQSFLC